MIFVQNWFMFNSLDVSSQIVLSNQNPPKTRWLIFILEENLPSVFQQELVTSHLFISDFLIL